MFPEAQPDYDGFDVAGPAATHLHELLDDLRDRLARAGTRAVSPRQILTIEQQRCLQARDGAEFLRALHGIARERHKTAESRHRQLEGLTHQAYRQSLCEADVLAYVDSILARLVPHEAQPAGSNREPVHQA